MIRPPPSSTPFPYTTLFRSSACLTSASSRLSHDRPWGRSVDLGGRRIDRKSTRLNSSHTLISYAVFCLKKKNHTNDTQPLTALTFDFNSHLVFLFFNDTATPEIYPLSLHDALPIIRRPPRSTLFPYTTLFLSRWSPYLLKKMRADVGRLLVRMGRSGPGGGSHP